MHEKEKEQAKQKERKGNKIQTCLTYIGLLSCFFSPQPRPPELYIIKDTALVK